NSAVVITGKMKHRLAHRFGRNGTGIDADAAHDGSRLNNGNPLVELGGGHSGALARGAGTDDNQVVFHGAHAGVSPRRIAAVKRDCHGGSGDAAKKAYEATITFPIGAVRFEGDR